jgi:FG-GAP repeat
MVLVGAPDEMATGGYGSAGNAYTFGPATGHLMTVLAGPTPASDRFFGASLGIDGSTLLAGAPGENALGQSAGGRAYTFNSTTGDMTSSLTSPSVQLDGGFGSSLASSGSTIVVGAPFEMASGEEGGHAYLS